MSINLHLPESVILKPCISVFGVGGAGCNAVNNMINSGLEGAKFIVANTDAQSLELSKAEKKIQLGETLTRGLGAGASPDIGRAAAEEAMDIIKECLHGSNMAFITAGMGGGTGTGAAPIIAKAARDQGILTVGVVTKPFHFEGMHRMKMADSGLLDLQDYVDTLIVIPNQNLFRIANEKTTFADAFQMADDVLRDGVRSITDLMVMPGLINLDFADIKSVMGEMGKAMMGAGESDGENRAIVAAEAAISNPLLDNSSMKGAKGVLINIAGGSDMTLFEVDEAANRIREEVDQEANIIFGSAFNETLEGKIRVSVVATGIEEFKKQPKKIIETVAPTPKIEEEIEKKVTNNFSEFAKKNIPDSYPSAFASKEYNQTKQDDFFVAEKPQELQQSFDIGPKQSYQAVSESNNQESTPKPGKKLGLFGRMANSVGFSVSKTKPEISQSTDDDISDDELDEYVTENIRDVPAFERRKNNK